jgi:predicted dehydrogenase
MNVILVGAGDMALEYAKVLKALNQSFSAVCRSAESALRFHKITGVMPETAGTDSLKDQDLSSYIAIVAVGIESLAQSCIDLIQAGCARILLEKPGALFLDELQNLKRIAELRNSEIKIGFNRRFYSSTIELQRIMATREEISSLHFEFNEFGSEIANLNLSDRIKERWIIANSIHVLDLAFYLCGWPKEMNSKTSESIDWHPSASIFAGSGKTENSTMFSYSANWNQPGRWKIEITSGKDKYLFQPIENLKIWNQSEKAFVFVELDDSLDLSFKPGLFLQTKEFILGQDQRLCDLSELMINWKTLCKIGNYKDF